MSFHSFFCQFVREFKKLLMCESPCCLNWCTVPEFIDLVFAKTSPKRSFSMSENEGFGLVFVKTGSINSGTGVYLNNKHTVLYILSSTVFHVCAVSQLFLYCFQCFFQLEVNIFSNVSIASRFHKCSFCD